MLTDTPLLPYYNPEGELVVENDAREYVIGSALLQKEDGQ